MKYSNLLISGGGIYGITILGIINTISKYNTLNNITKYLGTSVGSIICFLLILNYSLDDILKFIKNFNFELITSRENKNLNIFDNLINNYGFNNTNNLKLILENFLIGKNLKPNITFKELYLKTNKELIINISCLNDWTNYYINYKNNPNLNIIDTIIASCSIPIFFSPVKINEKYYVDGGLYNNRPIEFFNNELNKTLIITHYLEFSNINLDNIQNYLINLFFSKLHFNENKTLNELYNLKNTIIYTKIDNISPVTFNLSDNDIENLYNLGTKFGLKFIKNNYYYKYYLKKNKPDNYIYE